MPDEQFFDLSDGVLVGKGLDAFQNSEQGRAQLVSLFGGVENIPSSVMKAKRARPNVELDKPAAERGYNATMPLMASGKFDTLPKRLQRGASSSGKGCGVGALSTFPQNICKSMVLLYSKPGDTVFDPFCLPPGTWVHTSRGMSKIEDIGIGERVLTHRGRYRGVTNIIRRELSGELIKLKIAGSYLPLRMTGNHEVLAIRTTQCGYTSRIALPTCHTCLDGTNLKRAQKGDPNYRGFRERKCCQPWLNYKPEWVRADELRPGDYVLFPSAGETRDPPVIDLAQYAQINKQSHIIPVDEDTMWMLGMYVAEGHVSTSADGSGGRRPLSTAAWTLGSHELHHANNISSIAQKVFRGNAPVKLRSDRTVYDVNLRKSVAAKFLFEQFGHRAYGKRLPTWVMELPLSLQGAFLRGYIQGDGHVSLSGPTSLGEGMAAVTTSPNVAGQVRILLARQKIASYIGVKPPSKRQQNSKWNIHSKCDAWRIQVTGAGVPKLFDILGTHECEVPHYSMRSFIWGDHIAYRVISSSKEPYRGEVFNLTIDEDESYTLPQCSVHNCGHNSRLGCCVSLGRHYIGCDLCTEFMQFNNELAAKLRVKHPKITIELHHTDSRQVPVADNIGDMTITSPPYWKQEFYSDDPKQLYYCKTYEEFLGGLGLCVKENFRVLKPGAYAAWFINDFRVDGKMYFYHADLIQLGREAGFIAHDILITDFGPGIRDCFTNQIIQTKLLPKRHEYGIIFRKPLDEPNKEA